MHSEANDLSQTDQSAPPLDWPGDPEIEAHQPRNLLLLAAHQIVFRMGWIFKTESVIMPAFLDTVAGAGWVRGCLPMLNRLGQSVPPVFCAEQLRTASRKSRVLATFTALMSLPFALLAIACFVADGQAGLWLPPLFLVLYFMFFVFNGLYRMSSGTVQGKLIQPTRRGYLLLMATFWGSLPAMIFAWWLLPGWLESCLAGFGWIFAFTAVCFFLSALLVLAVHEPADAAQRPRGRRRDGLADSWEVLRRDGNMRRLVMVAVLFGSGLIVFPHYQAFAREELGLAGADLMLWVITQNAAVGIFSLFVGPLADALGNRLTLRTLVFGSAVSPLFVTLLSYCGQWGASLFWLVFIPLGVSPLVMRILINYTLETCEPDKHPRYLSTVALCLALPFVISPAVGWIVDVAGFRVVFLATTVLILLGGYMTFHLEEPRHRVRREEIGAVGVGGEE